MEQLTEFQKDLKNEIQINSVKSTKAYYNLVVSIRDVKLWKAGLKPHRYFTLKSIKHYFGINGNPDQLLEQLYILRENYNALVDHININNLDKVDTIKKEVQ